MDRVEASIRLTMQVLNLDNPSPEELICAFYLITRPEFTDVPVVWGYRFKWGHMGMYCDEIQEDLRGHYTPSGPDWHLSERIIQSLENINPLLDSVGRTKGMCALAHLHFLRITLGLDLQKASTEFLQSGLHLSDYLEPSEDILGRFGESVFTEDIT